MPEQYIRARRRLERPRWCIGGWLGCTSSLVGNSEG